jgi:hypothetical protein
MLRSAPIVRVLMLLVATLISGAALVQAGGEPRVWTDATGKFKVEAKFISQAKGKVTLEGKDGKRFAIDLSKLSAQDQKHLAELAKKVEPDDNPFKQVAGGAAVTPDWSGSRLVEIPAAGMEWKVIAKPAPEVEFKSMPVALPARQHFHEGFNALVVNPVSRRAVAGYHWNFVAPKPNSRILFCDIEHGKVLHQSILDGHVTPLAIDDDGTRGLFKRTVANKDQLEIWSLAATGMEKVLEWSPADAKGNGQDIRWAAFLDKNRLLTSSYGSGLVVLWELPSVKPLYHVMVQGQSVPKLSLDRKLLAFTTGSQVGVLDVDAGKVLGLRPATFTPWASLAFSPGGKWLACATNNRILIWDLGTGEQHKEISVNPADVFGYISWPNDTMMLIGNRSLLDLELAYRFWEFKDHNAVELYGRQGWFVTHTQQMNGAIVPALVPDAAVQEAFTKGVARLALSPGATVKIDVSELPDPAEREKAAKALEEKLAKKGCKVGPDGAITLVASTDLGKVIELNFIPATAGGKEGKFGFGFKGKGAPSIPPGTKVRTVQLQEHFSRLKFVAQGKTIWEASADNVPKSVQLEEGETLDQRMKKLERPNYAFFQTVDLPRFLHRDKGAAPLGVSQVTVSGVR